MFCKFIVGYSLGFVINQVYTMFNILVLKFVVSGKRKIVQRVIARGYNVGNGLGLWT